MSPLPILDHPSSTIHSRVILIDLPWGRDKDPRVPLGHASILSSLRAAGVDGRSIVRPINAPWLSIDELLSAVVAEASGLPAGEGGVVGFGAYVWCEHAIQQLLPLVREALPNALLVVGGPQVSFSPSVQGLYPDADCVVRGAGEQALLNIARSDRGAQIPGVTWRGGTDAGGQARVGLDDLASPFLDGTVPVRPGGFLRWETKRGCAFKCSFCQHRNPTHREYQRMPEGRIREEIRFFAARGVAGVAVLDPIFNDGRRSLSILDECKRAGLTARLSLQARLEMTDQAFLDSTKGLDVQLEFGLQTIHATEYLAVQRPNNMVKVERNLAWVREAGHPYEISLIYGLPNQTLSSFRESVAWCIERGVPTIKAFPLMLLRGTELERQRATWNLVENSDAIPEVIASSTFSEEEHRHMGALSEALRRTEGAHPCMSELLSLAKTLVPTKGRFSPLAA